MLYLSLPMLTMNISSMAQPPQAYYGGPVDGFASLTWYSSNSIFQSGPGDGSVMAFLFQENSIFEGGQGDGFNADVFMNPSSIFASAAYDGFSASSFMNSNQVMQGGASDGFAAENFLYYHNWTGLIGTGWNVAGNWENNIVPDDSIRARIPPGVPNFPFVNLGVFTIGSATGDYLCRELLVEPGATMTTRINTVTEIYSRVEIKGLMVVKNQSPNTFKVLGGTVLLHPGGELRVTND